MQVKLRWVNRNTLTVNTKVYRNIAYTESADLGQPIIILPGTTTEWIDESVVRGQDYWYTLGTLYETTEVFSKPVKVSVRYDTGPGPSVLQYGDSQLGYFGTVAATEFFTQQEILNNFGLSNGSVVNPLPVWDKWLRRGKVLFVPRGSFTLVSYQILYLKGAVFGPDKPKPTWLTLETTPQTATISKGFYKCIVRLPTGIDDRAPNDSKIASVEGVPLARRHSEIGDLIYPLCGTWFPPAQTFPRVPFPVAAVELQGPGSYWCQETHSSSGTILIVTGPRATTEIAWLESAIPPLTSSAYWKPILELVQSDLIMQEITL